MVSAETNGNPISDLAIPNRILSSLWQTIVHTRAETNLFDYAECRLFSHFCKDKEVFRNHLKS